MRNQAIAMSQAWKKPQFRNAEEFLSRIVNCKQAEIQPLEHKGRIAPGKYAIVDAMDGTVHSVATERYRLVQNGDILFSLAQAFDQMQIPFKGTVNESGGEMIAQFIIGENFDIRDSPYSYRLEVVNSYNKKQVVSGNLDLVRALCNNGMIGVAGCFSSMNARHLFGVDALIKEWISFIADAERITDNLPQVIERAKAQSVYEGELLAIYRALGVGQRDAVKIVDSISHFPGTRINAWDGYNAGTAFYSHRERGAYKLNRQYLEGLSGMLVENIQPLIQKGDGIITLESAKVVSSA